MFYFENIVGPAGLEIMPRQGGSFDLPTHPAPHKTGLKLGFFQQIQLRAHQRKRNLFLHCPLALF